MHEWLKNEQIVKKDIQKFENFSFDQIFQNDQIQNRFFTHKQEINYKGGELDLEFIKTFTSDNNEDYKILINKDGTLALRLQFDFRQPNGSLEVYSLLKKDQQFQHDEQLKGLGTKLYLLMLDYFQKIANDRVITFSHYVEKYPDFYKQNKNDTYSQINQQESSQIWDNIFEELLLTHGYKKVSNRTWVKKYKPEMSYEEMNEIQMEGINKKRQSEQEELETRQQQRIEELQRMEKEGRLFV